MVIMLDRHLQLHLNGITSLLLQWDLSSIFFAEYWYTNNIKRFIKEEIEFYNVSLKECILWQRASITSTFAQCVLLSIVRLRAFSACSFL